MKHTPAPWRWQFIGTMGNEFLVSGEGQDFKFCSTLEDKTLQAAAPELLEALEQAYLQINVLVEKEILKGSHMLAIDTDSLRTKMRNTLAVALGKSSQELQDNVCEIARNIAK